MEPTPEEPKDVIVLGAIKKGAKKFEKIQNAAQIDAEELNAILEQEKKTLEDSVKKINSITELKKESESYYKQIEQGVDTLLNILDSSTI